LIYILFGIISALSFGVSNVYWKTAAKDVDYPYLVFFRGAIASLFFGVLWFFLVFSKTYKGGIINTSASTYDYLGTIALCLVCSLGLVFFLKSMKYAQVSITIALASVNVIVGILTTVFIVREQFNTIYFYSFSLAIIGILLSRNFNFRNFTLQWNKGATYSLLASFFWGITYPLFKFASPAVGALPLSFILEAAVTLIALIWITTSSNKVSISELLQTRLLKHYGVLSLLLVGGTLFFNLAILQISVLNLDILSNFQIVVSIVLGIIIYREKLTKQQMVGIALILLSIGLSQYLQ
jgi:drug/metabolite transporter (DMT)-like permease